MTDTTISLISPLSPKQNIDMTNVMNSFLRKLNKSFKSHINNHNEQKNNHPSQ